jgi:hypothetical protein
MWGRKHKQGQANAKRAARRLVLAQKRKIDRLEGELAVAESRITGYLAELETLRQLAQMISSREINVTVAGPGMTPLPPSVNNMEQWGAQLEVEAKDDTPDDDEEEEAAPQQGFADRVNEIWGDGWTPPEQPPQQEPSE